MTDANQHSEFASVIQIALEQHTEGYFEQQSDALAALGRLVEQQGKYAHALGEIRSSLTALATGGIGEVEFAEEVQEALDGI